MTRKPPRRWAALAAAPVGLAVVAMSLTSVDQPFAQAQSFGSEAAAQGPDLALGAYSVTLLTGDHVYVAVDGKGQPAVRVESVKRPDGSKPEIEVTQTQDAIYAVPDDVRPALAAGHLDRGLFDVATLISNGYDDRSSKTLPVIMQYAKDATKRELSAQADEMPATPREATGLTSINAAAVDLAKGSVDNFWSELRPGAKPRAASLAAGVDKVWLDYKVTVTLDESVPMIGAPEAWAAGFDGTGVRVAVLDTGIDQTHPDLEGKVVASQSFVGDTVTDGHGHGTHVASTIAGSGAASDGKYKGVAPGADLLIGKVLNDAGSGDTSQIIAGMEWAALQEHADVISMSLGCADCPGDGTDPEDQAVDQLTEQTGALFVIAAGNSGPGSQTVASPGSADAALTVAAVDKSDQLAGFSSRGPRRGDGAMKPEIAAPGVNITAARADGTALGPVVDDNYTTISGTSMATPHVAGAAAILAQKYPDWAASQLKAGLMSTSKDDGYSVYQQGAGRVDVARAIGQTVFAATAKLDFENVQPTDAPVTKSVTYTNLGDTDVTLSLDVSAESGNGPVPDGTLAVGPSTVTVPAGGTASADVTLTPPTDASGAYSGALLATGTDDVQLTTPVGFTEFSEVTVTLDRRHDGADDTAGLVCATLMYTGVGGAAVGAAGDQDLCWQGGSTDAKLIVPAGKYFVAASIDWTSSGQPQLGYVFRQEVMVGPDTHLALDADETRPLSIGTPRPAELTSQQVQFKRTANDGSGLFHRGPSVSGATTTWLSPAEDPATGDFVFSARWSLAAPGDGAPGARDYAYILQPYEDEVPASARFAYDDSELALVKNYVHASPGDPSTGTFNLVSLHEEDYNLTTQGAVLDIPAPRVMPVYVGPTSNDDPKVAYYTPDGTSGTRAVERGAYSFSEAKTYRVDWGEKPVVPGPIYTPPDARLPLSYLYQFAGFLFGGCSGCREGDQFNAMVLMATPDGRNEAGYAGAASGFEPVQSGLDGLHLYGPDGEEITGRMHYPCDGVQHICTIGVG